MCGLKLQVRTGLRNLDDYDWEGDGAESAELRDRLTAVWENDQPVIVNSMCMEGYYNVTLPDGYEVTGLSWYHLRGFTQEGPDVSDFMSSVEMSSC